MNKDIIESPIILFENQISRRGAVVYLGHKMFPTTAARMSEYRADFKRFADQGLTISQATKKLGFSEDTVRRWAKVFKVTFKKKRNRPVRIYPKQGWGEAILAGAKKGETYLQIADRLGVPVINVYRYVKKMGINWKKFKSNGKN